MAILTQSEYEQKIKNLKDAAQKVGYSLEIYISDEHRNRRSSLWHGGLIAELSKINNIVNQEKELIERPLVIKIDAIGDVCLDIKGEMFKDKSNSGRMCGELISAGYYDDDSLYSAIDQDDIYIDANNWYEISAVYCGQWFDLEWVCDADDYLDAIMEAIDNVDSIEKTVKEDY